MTAIPVDAAPIASTLFQVALLLCNLMKNINIYI